MIIIYT